jgi:hypothetical protein
MKIEIKIVAKNEDEMDVLIDKLVLDEGFSLQRKAGGNLPNQEESYFAYLIKN